MSECRLLILKTSDAQPSTRPQYSFLILLIVISGTDNTEMLGNMTRTRLVATSCSELLESKVGADFFGGTEEIASSTAGQSELSTQENDPYGARGTLSSAMVGH